MRSRPGEILLVIGQIDGRFPASDRAAVGQAVGVPDAHVRVCGDADEFAIRYALAAGASEVVAMDKHQVDLVLFGRGGTEPLGELQPAQVALKINADLILDVLEFQTCNGGLTITRELAHGTREIISLEFPVVMVMSDNSDAGPYISRYRQNNVDWSPAEKSEASNALVRSESHRRWQSTRPRARTCGLAQKTAGNAQSRMFEAFGLTTSPAAATRDASVIVADAKTCATHLLRYLAHHEFVEWSSVPKSLSSPAMTGQVQPSGRKIRKPPTTGRPVRLPPESGLNRAPRPVGQSLPLNSRGPYPVPHSTERRRANA